MRRAHARYYAEIATPRLVVIDDIGKEDRSVTNDAEAVVADLHEQGLLPPGTILLYYDSTGTLDQLKHDGAGNFTGFAPGPRP